MGATLALPLLDGMMPAFASSVAPVRRLATVYIAHGAIMEKWIPAATGADFELTPILESLAPFRDRIVVVSGLTDRAGVGLPGEGSGDHLRAAASFLTGMHPKKTEGPDIYAGVSVDQIAARHLGKDTQLASIELSLESVEMVGACEAGYTCAYGNTLSWRDATTPLPMENQPRLVFERLFGGSDSTSQAARLARIAEDRSVLDVLLGEVARLQKSLGTGDRAKLNQYLEAIREIERRIQKAEEQSEMELPMIERPTGGIPDTFTEHAKVMFDLLTLAYQCDLTRVGTFMMCRETSSRAYPEIGIPDPHHGLSHHGNNPVQVDKLIKLQRYHMQHFAYFLEKLRATPEGDGTLLDNIAIVYGSGISDGNLHYHDNLPIVIAGGAGGRITGGRHVQLPKDTPLANLQLSLLNKLDVPADRFADSTGEIDQLSA